MRELYEPYTIHKGTRNIEVTDAQRNAVRQWFRVIKQRSGVGERGLYAEFQRWVLEGILGYDDESIYLLPNKNVDQKEPDFKITGDKASVLIEVKELDAKLDGRQYRVNERHETPIAQLWDYMNNTDPPVEYGICTNYVDFWLFARMQSKNTTHKFSLADALNNDDKLREFIWAFNVTIIDNTVSKLHAESIKHDQDITERFYSLFHDTRTRTYVNHPGAFTTIIPLYFRSVPELHGTSFIADAGQHDQDAGSARFTSGAPFSSWPACVCTVFRCVTSISSWY